MPANVVGFWVGSWTGAVVATLLIVFYWTGALLAQKDAYRFDDYLKQQYRSA